MLTRESLLAAADQVVSKPLKISVPHLGDVYVRLLSEDEAVEMSGKKRSWFVARVLCDEKGARLFGEANADEAKRLPYVSVNSIFKQAAKYNDMPVDEDEEEEDEGTEKN